MRKLKKVALRELKTHKLVYALLLIVFLVGIFFRTYRLNETLGFRYDQGRDALAVSRIIDGKLTLLGPPTGFEGIFRGPFYYYYILPGYLLGQGDPRIAAYYLVILNSLGIIALFAVASIFWNRQIGLLSATFWAFSYQIVSFDRWLSHPPILSLFSPISLGLILASFKFNRLFLIPGMFFLGLTLQLEEAGMGLVVLATILFLFLNKNVFGWKVLLYSFLAFLATLLPLVAFDLRHDFLISQNFIKLVFGGADQAASFGIPTIEILADRLWYFIGSLGGIIFFNVNWRQIPILWLIALLVLVTIPVYKSIATTKTRLLLLWILAPLTVLIFYQKAPFAYYLLGSFTPFVILVSFAILELTKMSKVKSLPLLLLTLFFVNNWHFVKGTLTQQPEGKTILIKNELQVLDFITDESQGQPVLIESYVPPQIPYAYDYLIVWYQRQGKLDAVEPEEAKLYFTIIEFDDTHPDLREAFISKADAKSHVLAEERFGGIIVQKRELK